MQLRQLSASLGFRRLESVRLIVDADGTIAEVTGVLHRVPRTVRVPLRTAARLIANGAPVRVDTAKAAS